MEQISFFEEDKPEFPLTHEDVLKLHEKYIAEGETDPDAFTWEKIKQGNSYFFYGRKVFEHVKLPSGKIRLRIIGEDKKRITLTSETKDILPYLEKLKKRKKELFMELNVEAFGCCNDFVRCSDAGKCLYPDDRFYNKCLYRQNLEAGRIFYGKNKNV